MTDEDPFLHFQHLGVGTDEAEHAELQDAGHEEPDAAHARALRRQERALRRRRAEKRRRTLVLVLVAVLVVGVGGFFVSQFASGLWTSITGGGSSAEPEVMDYPGPGGEEVDISVNQGDTGEDIATTLKDAGVIATRTAFLTAAKSNPASASIQPGTYTLHEEMRAVDALVLLIDPANRIDYVITVPEGWTVAQVMSRVQSVMGISAEAMTEAMGDTKATGLPKIAGGAYEGWLSPGQYVFALDTQPTAVIAEMVARTSATLSDLGVKGVDRQVILTKASIAEKEVRTAEDYGKVARVIDNRLDQSMKLQMDTIVAYGAGKSAMDLTRADFDNPENPYNAYVHTGLPPTPIANPGAAAIKATLDPPQGDWVWFVTVNLETGETKFTSSYAEFQDYSAQYREWKAKNYTGSKNDAG